MFCLLLSSAYLKSRFVSVACSASEELHKQLGWSKARTADLSWPKRYATLQSVMLIYKWRDLCGSGLNIAHSWAGYCCIGGEQFLLGSGTLSLFLLSITILNNTIRVIIIILFCFNAELTLISRHKVYLFLLIHFPSAERGSKGAVGGP